MKKILVTGVAGFIGSFLTKKLLTLGYNVVGIDNMNNYYDISLKETRISQLKGNPRFSFKNVDLSDKNGVYAIFESEKPEVVINLAAQAGVRYSITNPDVYIQSNVVGFYNILE